MSERAVTQAQSTRTLSVKPESVLQRKCACGQHTMAGAECETCAGKRLQRRAIGRDEGAEVPSIVHEVLRSPGQPLDAPTRAFMEPRFGYDFSGVRLNNAAPATGALTVVPSGDRSEHEADAIARRVIQSTPVAQKSVPSYDFSRVRVHTDSTASKSALALNARAYSVGNDIVFAEGQYRTGTSNGRELIAHELAHVAQSHANPSSEIRNALHRKTFETNVSACIATLSYLVRLNFDDQKSDYWDPPQNPDYLQRQAYFRNGFKKSTEDSFNSNTFRIKSYAASSQSKPGSKEGKSCPCPAQGFIPKLQINFPAEGKASTDKLDWDLNVKANMQREFITSGTNPASGTGSLDEADLTPQVKGSDDDIKQIPAVHEVGHLLGLDHPGAGIGGNIANEDPEYTHVGKDVKGREVHGPTDLMGEGMGLQPFYFNNWRDELNKKYGNSCNWQIVDASGALEKPERGLTPPVSSYVTPRWKPVK